MAEVVNTSWYRRGTISLATNSTKVTGTNTSWKTAGINPGATFRVDRQPYAYEVAEVVSDTELRLATPYYENGGSGLSYSIDRNFQSTPSAKMAADIASLVSIYELVQNDEILKLQGKDAYEVAVAAGYTGTREQWLESLKAAGELTALNSKIEVLTSHNSGAHNSVYRGKNLGTTLTVEQSAAIRSGTFDDIYIGDYWEMTAPAYTWTDAEGVTHEVEADTVSRRWYVLGLDYFFTNYPHLQMLTHHALVWPLSGHIGYTQDDRMNPTDTTEGGYVGSEFFTNNIRRYEAVYKAIWGDSHLARYSMELCNAVNNHHETGFARYTDRICDLLTVSMVGGNSNRSIFGYYRPLPITIFNPNIFTGGGRVTFLQDVYDGADFYTIRNIGSIGSWGASDSIAGYANPFCLVF